MVARSRGRGPNANVPGAVPHRSRRHLNPERSTPWYGKIFEWVVVLAVGVVAAGIIRTFLLQIFWIPTGSMENTLEVNDRVAVTPLVRFTGGIERGDVVVFGDEEGWLPDSSAVPTTPVQKITSFLNSLTTGNDRADQYLVKRVIGLPGDTVEARADDPHLWVNGVPITEPYLTPDADNRLQPFKVVVPDGHLWVMGDNRNYSADSRAHLDTQPFVSIDSVSGEVKWVVYPLSHWSAPGDNTPFEAVPNP